MGFDNPYRNINRDIGCALTFVIVVCIAIGYAIGKLF